MLVLFAACVGPEARARKLVEKLSAAVASNDESTYTRLADANMRTLIGRGRFDKEDATRWANEILQRPIRVVRTPQGVAFIGWVKSQKEYSYLGQIVVGEARAICHYTRLRQGSVTSDANDWKVAMIAMEEWSAVSGQYPRTQPAVEDALKTIDDAVLASWYFEGNADAERTIRKTLDRVSS